MSRKNKQTNKETKQNKTKKYIQKLSYLHYLSEVYRLGGGVEDFWENTWLDGDGGGGGEESFVAKRV